jgi:hypothetical protein
MRPRSPCLIRGGRDPGKVRRSGSPPEAEHSCGTAPDSHRLPRAPLPINLRLCQDSSSGRRGRSRLPRALHGNAEAHGACRERPHGGGAPRQSPGSTTPEHCLGGGVYLEAQLAVGGLAAALTCRTLIGRQIDSGRADPLVNVAAGDAGAVRTVPITFGQHRATTTRAATWWCKQHRSLLRVVAMAIASHP